MKRVLIFGAIGLAMLASATLAHAAGFPPEGVAFAGLGAAAVAAPLSESLRMDDAAAASVAVAPRVTLASIEAKIASEDTVVFGGTLTVHVLTMANGFQVTGESACASPANFNAELGRQIARDNAIRKVWALEGYLLREQIALQACHGDQLDDG